jgi:hypothetical protein
MYTRKIKPECSVDYNKYLYGVDNADQYLALYPFIRRAVKWSRNLFSIFFSAYCLILSACL